MAKYTTMRQTPLIKKKYLKDYLKAKGKFAHQKTNTLWRIRGNAKIYRAVRVEIVKRQVQFSTNKKAVAEFYADEFRRYQERHERERLKASL